MPCDRTALQFTVVLTSTFFLWNLAVHIIIPAFTLPNQERRRCNERGAVRMRMQMCIKSSNRETEAQLAATLPLTVAPAGVPAWGADRWLAWPPNITPCRPLLASW